MNEAIALNLSIITEGVGIYLWGSLCIMAIFKGDTKFVLCMWIYKYEGRTISNNTHLMSRYLVQKSLTNDKKRSKIYSSFLSQKISITQNSDTLGICNWNFRYVFWPNVPRLKKLRFLFLSLSYSQVAPKLSYIVFTPSSFSFPFST